MSARPILTALNDIGLALERAEAVTELLMSHVDGEQRVTVAALDAIAIFISAAQSSLRAAEGEALNRGVGQ